MQHKENGLIKLGWYQRAEPCVIEERLELEQLHVNTQHDSSPVSGVTVQRRLTQERSRYISNSMQCRIGTAALTEKS